MSVPEAENTTSMTPCAERSFYGRSYPRTNHVLGKDGEKQISETAGPLSAIAPLLDWAKKANWKNGGGNQGKAIAFPKTPFTPLYAFLAAKQLRIQKENPALSAKEVLVLAKADAAEEWERLSDKEQQVYVAMAQDDAQRYEDETAAFAKQHPELWAKHQNKRAKTVKLPTKPKAAKTAWRAFLEKCVQTAVEEGNISEDTRGLQRQIEVMKDAAAAWKQLSDEEREPFMAIAEEDKKRYKEELKKFPDYKAKLDKKVADKLAVKKQKDAKKAIYEEAKPDGKKGSVRPARKRALPKPKPLVKRGKYVGKGADKAEPPRTRSRKALEPLAEEEDLDKDAASDSEESGDSGVDYDDDSDQDAESEAESLGQSEDDQNGEETDPINADKEPVAASADSDPDLSEDEDEAHANKENAAPSTIEKTIQQATFVADTPAAPGVQSDDEDEDDDASLRAVSDPADLLQSNAEPKEGILSWARAALMSGFKGMWARGGSQTPAEVDDAEQGPATKKRKR